MPVGDARALEEASWLTWWATWWRLEGGRDDAADRERGGCGHGGIVLGLVEAHAFDCPHRPRRAIVCGSRHWNDPAPIEAALKALPPHSVVLHGACPTGADALADLLATRRKIRIERFEADWERYGKCAGPLRNAAMLAAGADLVLAFWDGASRGTANMIGIARAAGVEVRVARERAKCREEHARGHASGHHACVGYSRARGPVEARRP